MRIWSGIREGLWWVPVVAVLAVLPFFWRGTSNGHDLPFHVNSWIEVARQWKTGIVYPHWAASANYGSGEPRFVFYPPVSWVAGALLGLVLPWAATPGTLSAIVMIAAGISMYLFASEWLEDQVAVIAAIFYAVNPYMLLVIYMRSAYGEMIAAVWLPGLLLFALRERGGLARNTLLLATHVALIWLTNLPAAVIASYLLAGVATGSAFQKRSAEPLLRATGAMALGLALAAFFLIPAVYEERWVQISQAIADTASAVSNLMFRRTGDQTHDHFLAAISFFAIVELAAIGTMAWRAKRFRDTSRGMFNIMVGIAAFAGLLMTPLSYLIWKYAPKLMYVQFPWRWLMVVNFSLAIFAGVTFSRTRSSRLALLVVIPVMVVFGHWRLKAQIYPEDRPTALAEAIESGTGYEGTDEYTPTQADNSKLEANAPRIAIQIASQNEEQRKVAPSSFVHSAFQEWGAERKRFTIDSQVPTRDTLRLLAYPAWRVQVDGKAYAPEADEETGRMVLDLPAGHHAVAIDYARTPDRTWGFVVSVVALLVALGMWSLRWRERRV